MPAPFDQSPGSPTAKIRFWGVDERIGIDATGIVDTGFTGFLQVPIQIALGAALILTGIAPFTLADGSIKNSFLCLGTVRINDQNVIGLISLSEGSDILIGTELLFKMNKLLLVDFQNKGLHFLDHQTPPQIQPPSSQA
jgi:predicted aspartyl protease